MLELLFFSHHFARQASILPHLIIRPFSLKAITRCAQLRLTCSGTSLDLYPSRHFQIRRFSRAFLVKANPLIRTCWTIFRSAAMRIKRRITNPVVATLPLNRTAGQINQAVMPNHIKGGRSYGFACHKRAANPPLEAGHLLTDGRAIARFVSRTSLRVIGPVQFSSTHAPQPKE